MSRLIFLRAHVRNPRQFWAPKILIASKFSPRSFSIARFSYIISVFSSRCYNVFLADENLKKLIHIFEVFSEPCRHDLSTVSCIMHNKVLTYEIWGEKMKILFPHWNRSEKKTNEKIVNHFSVIFLVSSIAESAKIRRYYYEWSDDTQLSYLHADSLVKFPGDCFFFSLYGRIEQI